MKRGIVLVLVVSMILTVLTGCTSSPVNTATTSSPNTAPANTSTAGTEASSSPSATESGLNPIINMDSLIPVTKEVVKPKLVVNSTSALNIPAREQFVFAFCKKCLNIDFDVTQIPGSAWKERLSLMLNTGDLPDAVTGSKIISNTDIVKYLVEGGLGYDMTEDIAQYAPDITRAFTELPAMKASCTYGGKIVALSMHTGSYTSPQQRDWVRSDWLKKLGLDKPSTLAEYKNMLIAFRDNDPNGNGKKDEIAWGGSWKEGFSENEMIISALGYVGGGSFAMNYNTDKPTLSYFPLSEAYDDYLKFMSECWAEGLMDPDMFSQTDTASLAKVAENIVGVASSGSPSTLLTDDAPASYKDYIYTALKPMSSKDGGKVYYKLTNAYAPGCFFISANSEYADVLVRFANLAFTWPTLDVFANPGTYSGSQFDVADNHRGAYTWNDADSTFSYEEKKANFPDMTDWDYQTNYIGAMTFNFGFIYQPPEYMFGEFTDQNDKYGTLLCVPFNKSPEDWTHDLSGYMGDYGVLGVPNLSFTSKEYERIAELQTPISDYVSSMEAKIITGAEPLSAYDEMIKTLKSLGAEEYQKIYSDAYEAYKALGND